MRIGVVVKNQNKEALFYSQKVIDVLSELKAKVLMLKENKNVFLKNFVEFFNSIKELVASADIVLTVGGDGTLIDTAYYCALFEKPVLGINLGKVGFAATLEKSEISKLESLVKKDFILNPRSLMSIKIEQKEDLAVNDIVFSKEEPHKIENFCIEYKNKTFHHRADAIMFSTPTGSTAYSFSAGGPIIDPSLDCILMSQICPFSLFSRSIIFSKNEKILVQCKEQLVAVIDGNRKIKLSKSFAEVSLSDVRLNIISFEDQNFYKTFKEKFKKLGDT